jgi:hypothetical protein
VQRDLAAINIAPAFGILLRCHTRFIDAFDRRLKKVRPGYSKPQEEASRLAIAMARSRTSLALVQVTAILRAFRSRSASRSIVGVDWGW